MAEVGAKPGETMPQVDEQNRGLKTPLEIPPRLLMGPGPSNAYPRVLDAQSLPLLGHLHPPFLAIMDEIKSGLQYVFQTTSPYCCLISGTGHAGIECSLANLLEPGETVVIGSNGIWGERASDMATRYGAKVEMLQAEAGKSFSLAELTAAVEQHKPAVLFLVHGESSTGVQQNLAGVGDLCKANNVLLLVDTVCTLGGVPLFFDDWGIDCAYSGSQKCLSAPPGAAPLCLSKRALDKITSRRTKVASYYFDLTLIGDYWGWFGPKRFYHHTGMVSNWYGLREALAIASEEGLEALWQRHQRVHRKLWAGLSNIPGLVPFVEDPAERLPTVNTIKVPEGCDWESIRALALKNNVEIAGGLGPSTGKVWRVGVMGYNATEANVDRVVDIFRYGLDVRGGADLNLKDNRLVPTKWPA